MIGWVNAENNNPCENGKYLVRIKSEVTGKIYTDTLSFSGGKWEDGYSRVIQWKNKK